MYTCMEPTTKANIWQIWIHITSNRLFDSCVSATTDLMYNIHQITNKKDCTLNKFNFV